MTDPESSTLMDPDDEFEPDPVRDEDDPEQTRHVPRAGTVGDLEIPSGARTMRNLRDRNRVIE